MKPKIKFQFDANQDYQLQAINSTVDLFEGMGNFRPEFSLGDEIKPNLPEDEILFESEIRTNLENIQERNGVPIAQELEIESGMVMEGAGVESHEFPSFTVEMETGTGKTYVYLRTIYELFARYGFTKFIIVVPSVAIYEGVRKTEEITRSHFASLYENNTLNLIPYDGNRVNRVRSFATANTPQVLLMTIDAFNKTSNNFYKQTDALQGSSLRPFEFVQKTRPIVILDEPQSIDNTEKAKAAIRTLKPLFTLRYSATHRRSPNLIYRLTPVEAYHRSLVKKIEVTGIGELETLHDAQLALQNVEPNPFRAKIRTLVLRNGISNVAEFVLKQGDDLFTQTKREEHRNSFVVKEINVTPGNQFISFENGEKIRLGAQDAPMRSEVFRAQIRETVCEHLEKQERLAPHGIKVLSLFFIDRVENYTAEDGIIRRLFDEIFDELKQSYSHFKNLSAEEVRGAYFAKKKVKEKDGEKEIALNTESRNKEEREAEKAAFSLIMREKEKILAFDEPVSFIFAHSALREGWDNPNVFQICTLNQSRSDIKKRQEIGRGLRLCVNQNGERIFDDDVNILRVVANESYQQFVEQLQNEYHEAGEEAPPKPTKPRPSTIHRNDDLFTSSDFREFWARLSRRTSYKIKIDTDALIDECVQKLQFIKFPEPKIIITKGRFVLSTYNLKLEKIENGTAYVVVERKTSDSAERVDKFPLKVGSSLARATGDNALRDYKVLEIIDEEDAERVIFTNEQILTRYQQVHFNVSHGQKPLVAEVKNVNSDKFPVFDFIGRAVKETQLTRKTLNQIFFRLPETVQQAVFRNPEGFADKFIETIRDCLAVHVAKNVEFTVDAENAYDLEELFPTEKKVPQRELVEACSSGLYNKMQVDSEVEVRFVERCLRRYPNVILYFKFPPKFKLDFPSIIHDYNPDWGIIRKDEGGYKLELVVETKGTTDIEKLRFSSEGWKIRCAERYFDTLGIRYKVSDSNSFNWNELMPKIK